jgi:hypothetical protein
VQLLYVGVVLLGLFVILAQLNRRVRGGGVGQGRQTVALTGQHALHVVEIAGRRLLVGTGPSGAPRVLAELGELAADTAVAEQATPSRPWAELVERFGGLVGR